MSALEHKLSTVEMLRAVARFAEEQKLRQICLLEVEGGVMVQGYALVETREGWSWELKTQTLSHKDMAKLLKKR